MLLHGGPGFPKWRSLWAKNWRKHKACFLSFVGCAPAKPSKSGNHTQTFVLVSPWGELTRSGDQALSVHEHLADQMSAQRPP